MKRNVTINELVQELQTQNIKKSDLVIPAKCLTMEQGQLVITNCGGNSELDKILYETGISTSDGGHKVRLDCLDVLDAHLSDKLGIPARYFQKMREGHHSLLDENVTYWLQNNSSSYLLRTFIDKDGGSGVARALLSDRFKVIDNYDILLTVLGAIKESGLNVKIDNDSCDLSDKRMYVRFTVPDVEINAPELLKNYRPNGKQVDTGDGIISGFVISNSEVGHGSLSIMPRAVVLKCRNGMVRADERFAQRHLGAKMNEYETIQWSDTSKQKNLELIMSQIKDCIKLYASEEYLGKFISETIEKGTKELAHPMDAVKNVTQSLGMSEEKQSDILNFFIKSGDMTSFGLVQSVTLFAGQTENPDERYDLEAQVMGVLDNIEQFDKPLPKKSNKTLQKLN